MCGSVMSDFLNSIFGFVVVCGAIFIFIDWGFLNDELTLYPAQCVASQNKVGPQNCKLKALTRITYRINESRAEAVYFFENDDPSYKHKLAKLVNCKFKDRTNWTCNVQDSFVRVHVRDGLAPPDFHNQVYLRRWQWYFLYLFGPGKMAFIPDQIDLKYLGAN